MCGILAILDFDGRPVREDLLLRMRDTMVHRGPDDAGVFLQGPVGLAHRRLSIIDLSRAGHQPMSNEDGSVSVVFNGEIYNHVELREDLKRRGHLFRSTSDTETILHQYEEDGERCLEKFNGMFAFVLWDRNRRTLFAARDRIGIKPLYYFMSAGKIILASEIKSILEDPAVPRTPDYRGIADYMFASTTLGGKTAFREIHEVAPGHSIRVSMDGRTFDRKKYWDVLYRYDYARPDRDVRSRLYELLDDAVRVHCRSDAPLGCHLSGGLDSSTVVAFTARHREALKAFSIKFSGESYIDETGYAREVASHVGAEYLESSPDEKDLVRLLPVLIWHMDVPMATDGGFSYYTVSRLAKQHVKVSMTGHGGDELFAGYPAQFQAAFQRVDMFEYRIDPSRIFVDSFRSRFLNALKAGGIRGIYEKIRNRFGKREETLEDLWVRLHCGSSPENNPVFQKDFIRQLEGYSPRGEYIRPFSENNTDEILDRCLYHDFRVYLPSLLHLEDRVSMALSIESRVPLLDHRIVEFLATVPPAQKVDGLVPKRLLREAVSTLLPERVWKRRDKLPFPVPGRFWGSDEVKALIRNTLLSPECLDRGIFNPGAIRDAVEHSNLGLVWQFLNVELWFRIFIDRDAGWLSQARGEGR